MLVGLGFLFVFFGVRAQRQHRLRERLLTDGEKATAKVLRLTKTNATRNRLSQFRIRLQVTTPRHGKYEKDIKEYLTPTKANVMSPGSGSRCGWTRTTARSSSSPDACGTPAGFEPATSTLGTSRSFP
jgi:hypothetical protein